MKEKISQKMRDGSEKREIRREKRIEKDERENDER